MVFEPTGLILRSKKLLIKVFPPKASSLAPVLIGFFFLGTTACWLVRDQSPETWDDAWYLTNSLVLYDSLIDDGFIGYWKKFLGVLEFKAPLIAVLPTALYRLFGRHSGVAYGVNLIFMVLLFGAVYRLARHYSSSRAGLIAVFLTATMPLLYGLSRQYLVEYGLTALVAATVACLAESDCLKAVRKATGLGCLCGLGLMMKVSFPLYVCLPFCFAVIRSLAPGASAALPSKAHPTQLRGSLLGSLFAFVAPMVLIALPWYWRNWRKALDHAFSSGFSPVADLYGMGDPFSGAVIWRYLTHWVNDGISGGYLLLLMALTGTALWQKIRIDRPLLPPEGRTFILLWLLPFVVFLFGRNKDIRFTAPLLPAIAILLAWMAGSVLASQKKWGRLAFSLLFSFPLLAYLHTSFGILGNTRLVWGDLVLLNPHLSHARRPDPKIWPHQQILDVLRLYSPFPEERTIMLGSDTAHFNANNFELAVVEGLDSFQITTSAYEEDLPSLLNAANSTMFFVYKVGGETGPQHTNQLFKPLLVDVQSSGKFYDWSTGSFLSGLPSLPDGGKVVVYQNRYPNSAVLDRYTFDAGVHSSYSDLEKPTCTVSFGNLMKLIGLSFAIEKQWLKVSYTWSSTEKLDPDLFCFTHILDDRGRVLGYLDHAVPEEPVMGWKQAWGAREILRYCLPDGVSHVKLRLGLFRKSSGERFKIQEAIGYAGPKFSVTDGGTAVFATGMTPLPPMRSPGDN